MGESYTILGGMIAGVLVVMLVLAWLAHRDTKKTEARLAELAHMSAVAAARDREDSRRFWRDNEAFWERADKRWADHEALMRMIFERVDRDHRPG